MASSTVRQSEKPFGTDHGLIHEVVVTGRSVGADEVFWTKLAHDADLFRKVVGVVNNDQDPTATSCSPSEAAAIMGDNFHGLEVTERHFSLSFNAKQKKILATVPFSPAVLQACSETHVLVACASLSLMDVWEKQRELCYAKSDPWYGQPSEQFGSRKVKVAWQLVRKDLVPGSTSKTWDEQQALLSGDELVPSASVLAQAIFLHYLETKERLFQGIYARTSDVGSDGRHVYLGGFDEDGLFVDGDWGDGRGSVLGLSSSRKFS